MPPAKKNKGDGQKKGSSGRTIHESGLTMPRSLFARLDRIVKHAGLRSRGELLLLGVTTILDMCDDPTKRYLPEVCINYDKNSPVDEDLGIANPAKPQRCGTHFEISVEDRIQAVIKRIGWSRNQFIWMTAQTMVDWCEDPTTRTVPDVVLFFETAREDVPLKLKRKL